MRTLIDLGPSLVEELDAIAKANKQSRASLIREALHSYIAGVRSKSSALDDAFGLWSDRAEDAIDYQTRLRREW